MSGRALGSSACDGRHRPRLKDFPQTNVEQVAAGFVARLHSFVTTKQKTALRFRSFFAPRTEVALHLRNVAVKALSIPFLANRLTAGSLRGDLVLPDYLAG